VNLIESVVSGKMCTGCGLCTLNEMKFDVEGYARPVNGVSDDITNNCCPGISVAHYNTESNYSRYWGPIKRMLSGHSNDKGIRNIGSSGGVITTSIIYLLQTKQVDAVIQIGADKKYPLLNNIYINDLPVDVIDCSGSRYSPSSPLSVIRGLLNDEKKYAVIGKPCDIAAMRALKNMDENYNLKFPFLISFFCAGVPSINASKDILSKFKISEEDLIEFKYRGDGWPGLTKAVVKDGTKKTMTYNESWGSILNKKLQPRCKICADGIGEAADIVCGDAWAENDEGGYPCFDEKDGESLIVIRTTVGDKLISDCVSAGMLITNDFDMEQLARIQPFQKERKELAFYRHLALVFSGRMVTKFQGYRLFKLSLSVGVIRNVRTFLGALKRSLKGKL